MLLLVKTKEQTFKREPKPIIVKPKKQLPSIGQYSLEGELITVYESLSIASKQTGIRWQSIQKAYTGAKRSAGGFQWVKDFVEKLPTNIDPIKKTTYTNESKPVFQLDDMGNMIKRFSSLNEASRETGIQRSSISDALKGRQKRAGGFHWKYDE